MINAHGKPIQIWNTHHLSFSYQIIFWFYHLPIFSNRDNPYTTMSVCRITEHSGYGNESTSCSKALQANIEREVNILDPNMLRRAICIYLLLTITDMNINVRIILEPQLVTSRRLSWAEAARESRDSTVENLTYFDTESTHLLTLPGQPTADMDLVCTHVQVCNYLPASIMSMLTCLPARSFACLPA